MAEGMRSIFIPADSHKQVEVRPVDMQAIGGHLVEALGFDSLGAQLLLWRSGDGHPTTPWNWNVRASCLAGQHTTGDAFVTLPGDDETPARGLDEASCEAILTFLRRFQT